MILRDVLTAIAKKEKMFRLAAVVEETGHARQKVKDALRELEEEGHIARVSEHKPQQHNALKDIIYIKKKTLPGRLASLGTNNVTCATHYDTMWRVIRYNRQFTAGGLITATGLKETTVRNYIHSLKKAGYLKKLDWQTFVLVKNPGPKRPSLTQSSTKEATNNVDSGNGPERGPGDPRAAG